MGGRALGLSLRAAADFSFLLSIPTMAAAAGYSLLRSRITLDSHQWIVLSVGFVLIVAIYVQTALLFGVYTPELFPTEIRLRANGICNTLGRLATVFSPFIVGALLTTYKLPGVIGLMIGLLIVQIVVVWVWGVEPAKRSLEHLETRAATT